MATISAARHAMATRFEIVLHGEREFTLRAAAEEALDEIERLDRQLSLYRSDSDIARLNATAAHRPVKVEPRLFSLLRQAVDLTRQTGGSFDVTVAPLMRCWGLMQSEGVVPDQESLARARELVGPDRLQFVDANSTIQFDRPGVMLDLGSIGKGYALDRAVELLREAGISSALIHGGTSTVCAIGSPPDAECWTIGITAPPARTPTGTSCSLAGGMPEGTRPLLARVKLMDETLSVSAVHGKSFQVGDRVYGHVIDPRSGEPVVGAQIAAMILDSATEGDALSTALLVLGAEGGELLGRLRPNARLWIGLLDDSAASGLTVHCRGMGRETDAAAALKSTIDWVIRPNGLGDGS